MSAWDAAMTAARDQGHDPHPWVPKDDGSRETGCRRCGMKMRGKRINGTGALEVEGQASMCPCEPSERS